MTRPSPADIRSWAPGAWGATADGLSAAASEFTRAGSGALDDVQNLGFDQWSGRGRRACETAVAESSGVIRRAAAAIEEAADACRRAADQIGPVQEALISTYEALICSNYSVSDNWTVRDQLFGAFDTLSGPDARLARERESEALNETVRLQQLADTAAFTDADTARNLRTLLRSAQDTLPSAFGFSASSAEKDVDALLHGTATAEERARFLEATSLGAAREVEGDIVISKSQMDYLEALFLRLEDKGIGGYHFWGHGDHAVREGLVRALTLSSEPRVRTDELIPVAQPSGPGQHPTEILEVHRRAEPDTLPPLARKILDEAKASTDTSHSDSDDHFNPRGFAVDAASSGLGGALKLEADDLERTGKHALNRESLVALAPDLRAFSKAIGVVGPAVTAYSGYEEWSSGEASGAEATVKTAAALAGGAAGGSAAVGALGASSTVLAVPPVLAAVAVGVAAAGISYGAHAGADYLWDKYVENDE